MKLRVIIETDKYQYRLNASRIHQKASAHINNALMRQSNARFDQIYGLIARGIPDLGSY